MDPLPEPVPGPPTDAPTPPVAAGSVGNRTGGTLVERPSPLTGLARSGIALAAVAVIIVREFLESGEASGGMALFAGIAAGVVALLGGVSGIITWRTTTFVADDAEFRVEKNFISHSSSRVDYTKVQSIDVSQPFVARLLGLAKVHIDVGGAGGVDLAYLTKARAESLREHLLANMASAFVGGDEAAPRTEEPEGELVIRVPVRTLLLGALVSMGASLSLVFAVVFLIVTFVAETPVTLFASAAAIVGWLWSQTAKNWGFTMTRSGDALRIRRGLLSTVTQGLKPHRIQAVSIEQDILQRLTGLYQVSVTVLGYGDPGTDEDGANNAIVLPFGTWGDVMTVLHAFWPDLDLSRIEAHPQPERARWLTPVSFATHTWGIGDDVVIAQHGLITQRRAIVPHRRMQSASIEQGPLQRRLRLAEIAIHTTDGPVSLRLGNLDESVARATFLDQLERARLARLGAN